MCLNEICSTVGMEKYLSDTFPIQNCLKQGYTSWQLPLNFPSRRSKKEGIEFEWDTSASGVCGWYKSLLKRLVVEVRLNTEKTSHMCRI
jgi:hypothetical protein